VLVLFQSTFTENACVQITIIRGDCIAKLWISKMYTLKNAGLFQPKFGSNNGQTQMLG